jgi:hypothetical protein
MVEEIAVVGCPVGFGWATMHAVQHVPWGEGMGSIGVPPKQHIRHVRDYGHQTLSPAKVTRVVNRVAKELDQPSVVSVAVRASKPNDSFAAGAVEVGAGDDMAGGAVDEGGEVMAEICARLLVLVPLKEAVHKRECVHRQEFVTRVVELWSRDNRR